MHLKRLSCGFSDSRDFNCFIRLSVNYDNTIETDAPVDFTLAITARFQALMI